MHSAMTFEAKTRLGYVFVAVLIAAGMGYAIQRMSTVADEQIAQLRSEENAVTLAERLRWSSELLVSSGRAYLISIDPGLFAEVRMAKSQFEDTLDLLRNHIATPTGDELLTDVQRAAANFTRMQEQLLDARRRGEDSAKLVTRFDTELVGKGRALDAALNRLIDHRVTALERLYDHAGTQRTRLVAWMYGLLVGLVLAGLAFATYFARLLGRSFRAERKATEAAQRAVATRDEVMAIVAHDLRNPLGAITMTATLLEEEADPSRSRERAATIANVAMRMEYLIKTMLDLATMEAGRFALMQTTTPVDELLAETAQLFRPLAKAKKVTLDSHAPPGLMVHADRERVLQVLSNLIGNALRFTPPGGHVKLTVKEQRDEARFAVADTGPGISGDKLPHVFERFWSDLTPGVKSTGLGLFIAKEIVSAHGGRIWVESSPGHGACFMFTLPLELRPQVPIARTVPQPGERHS